MVEVEKVLEEKSARRKEELERLQKEHEEIVQALDTEAYNKGYLEAGKDYAHDIYKWCKRQV